MINISFISQEKTLFEGKAEMVVMDGQEGQLGIVKGHSPLLAILKPGPVRMITSEKEEVFFTEGGFAEVQPESITILVDAAQRADDLDEAKILKAKEEAEMVSALQASSASAPAASSSACPRAPAKRRASASARPPAS